MHSRRSGSVYIVETRFVEQCCRSNQTQTNRKIARGSDDFTYLKEIVFIIPRLVLGEMCAVCAAIHFHRNDEELNIKDV